MDAKALPGNDSRYVQLMLSLKEVPDILLDHFGAGDKYGLSHFCFASGIVYEAITLPTLLRKFQLSVCLWLCVAGVLCRPCHWHECLIPAPPSDAVYPNVDFVAAYGCHL